MGKPLAKPVMSHNGGMTSRFTNLGCQPGRQSLITNPLTGATNFTLVLRVGGNTRYGHKILESLQVILKFFIQAV